jgi:PAS domain S-box-containing protein
MSEPATLADHLDEQTDTILSVWRTTVERVGDVPESERLSYAEFTDHIPALLDRLAERLRGRPGDAIAEGKEHGKHRWRQGYDIGEVVSEFAHLRTALCRATTDFAREHDWSLSRLETVFEAIDEVLSEATAESVRQFQEDSRAETRKALDEVQSRQHAVEEAWAIARSEQAKLRTILRSLPAAVWVVDAEGTFIGANDVADRIHSQIDPHYIGRANVHSLGPEYRLFRPNAASCTSDDLPLCCALRGETVIQEELIWEIHGEPRTLLFNAAPLTDPDGILEGAVGVAQDVTERKRGEEEFRRQGDLFRTITEALGEGLCTVDLESRVTFANPAAERLLGWSRDELLGRNLHETARFLRPDGSPFPFEECPLFEALQTGRTVQGDERLVRKDGTRLTVALMASPIVSDGRCVGLVVVLRDVTERIEQDAALLEQRERAEEASRHKTRLVSALSHDVRTPLNAVVLAAQLLEIHFDGATDSEVQECLQTIRLSVRNVLDLLGDLLNLSKLDAGAMPPEITRFPLEPVFAECLASIETQARMKGLDLRLELGNLAGTYLDTDRAKLKQIVANFLSNAVRYTEQGQIRLLLDHSNGQVRIAVADTGVGIDPRDQEKIFDEFAVLEHPRRSIGEGTGLGLAICRRLAGLLGGEIHLTSAPGQGSTFTLILPDTILTKGQSRPAPDHAPEMSGTEVGAILVAEDHPESRQTLSRVLRRMGYRVLEASNGRDALDLIRNERPFAVLMDVNMPVMNGVEATLALRADPRFRDLPIFALTGDVTPDNQHRIGEAGVSGYLEKPVSWDLLKQALSALGHRTPD